MDDVEQHATHHLVRVRVRGRVGVGVRVRVGVGVRGRVRVGVREARARRPASRAPHLAPRRRS